MSFDYPAILDAWLRAMTTRDLEGVMRTCHPNIRLGINLGDLPVPFIGVTTGIEPCRRRTRQIFDTWVIKAADLRILAVQGHDVRSNLALTIQHRWTGFCIDTSIRQHFHFEDGLIRSFDAFMDVPRFAAFMRYVGIAPSKAVRHSAD